MRTIEIFVALLAVFAILLAADAAVMKKKSGHGTPHPPSSSKLYYGPIESLPFVANSLQAEHSAIRKTTGERMRREATTSRLISFPLLTSTLERTTLLSKPT